MTDAGDYSVVFRRENNYLRFFFLFPSFLLGQRLE